MSLLPSRPDTAAAGDAEPRVVGVESDDADQLLSALSSATSRRLLGELHDDPAPPADLADRVDTSLQNAQYHLEKLEDAGAVQVVDTAYSQKGREMDVYAPADRPLVIFAGDEDSSTAIRTALTRLLGGLAGLAFASIVVQQLASDGLGDRFGGGADGGAVASTATPTVEEAAAAKTDTVVPTGGAGDVAIETAAASGDAIASGGADAAAGLPPGVLFFLGGATVLFVGFLVWYFGQ